MMAQVVRVDTLSNAMNAAGDKMVTNGEGTRNTRSSKGGMLHERDHYAKAVELLGELKLPLVAAVEDYVQDRKLAESESLTSMPTDHRKFFKPLTRRVTLPEMVAEVLMREAECLRANPDQPLKLLVSGAPGIGKTSLVNTITRPRMDPLARLWIALRIVVGQSRE
jgi:hypothetical protein